MNLFGLFHAHSDNEAIILVEIGALSVSGAYAYYKHNEPPRIVYASHLPIQIRENEPEEKALERALKSLATLLVREGAPALVRAAGRGNADLILVSIDAPWQNTSVRTEHFEDKEPFTFTKDMLAKRLDETNPATDEAILADESVIGSILNGYVTREPYGREAHRAAIILFSSLIKKSIAHVIVKTLREEFHTKDILPISGTSLRYQAVRTLFPHEHDAIILDATERSLAALALIRQNLFVTLRQAETESDTKAWMKVVLEELTNIAQEYPLPRTIFLLAKEEDVSTLEKALDCTDLRSLWLTENPPKVVSVLDKHLKSLVRQDTATESDVSTMLMALYYKNRNSFSADPFNTH